MNAATILGGTGRNGGEMRHEWTMAAAAWNYQRHTGSYSVLISIFAAMATTTTRQLIDRYREQILHYRHEGLNIMATSSFQTHSIPMLHLLSKIDPTVPVYFLNTGYHFPQTLDFKDEVAAQLGLQVIDLESPVPKLSQRDRLERLYFTSDPDYCCYLNKTLPLEPVLMEYDIWVTGVRHDQNDHRSRFEYETPGKYNTTRFHPMLEWSNKMIYDYIREHDLPRHPLENEGYMSIGCEPCTIRLTTSVMESERGGRWFGLNKTECGLHTDLNRQTQE